MPLDNGLSKLFNSLFFCILLEIILLADRHFLPCTRPSLFKKYYLEISDTLLGKSLVERALLSSNQSQGFLLLLLADENAVLTPTTKLGALYLSALCQNQKLLLVAEQHISNKKSEVDEETAEKLARLWRLLMQAIPPSIPSEAWTQIGFQGRNPITDFRGLGMYGLMCLLSAVEKYPREIRTLLVLSQSQEHYFPFCTVAFNVANFLHVQLKTATLVSWFQHGATIEEAFLLTMDQLAQDWQELKDKNLLALGKCFKKAAETSSARLTL